MTATSGYLHSLNSTHWNASDRHSRAHFHLGGLGQGCELWPLLTDYHKCLSRRLSRRLAAYCNPAECMSDGHVRECWVALHIAMRRLTQKPWAALMSALALLSGDLYLSEGHQGVQEVTEPR